MMDVAMRNTDTRVAEDKPVTVMFLLAVFLWEPIRRRALELQEEGLRRREALFQAADQVDLLTRYFAAA